MEEQSDKGEDEQQVEDEIHRIRSSVASRPSQIKCTHKITPEDFNTTPVVVVSDSEHLEHLEQSNIDDILTVHTNHSSQCSLNFGDKNEFNTLVPPEVKDWLVSTFSSVQEEQSYKNKEKLGKITGVLKKFSANIFGKWFLCCASCCCLNCCVKEENINEVAQRITIATTHGRPPAGLDRKTIRKTRRNSLLLREQINNNNMLTQQNEPIVFNERDCKLMQEYHRDRLRKHLTYPNNVVFRCKKPSAGKRFKKCLKQCFCCGRSEGLARPQNLSSQRPSVRSMNRVTDSFNTSNKKLPAKVKEFFKDQVNLWEFNIFKLPTEGHTPLKWMVLELLSKYQLIKRFDIPTDVLDNFCHEMEQGYQCFDNQYHNARHAADVLQTIHHLLVFPGLLHWLSDVEILSLLIAAAAHDLEHTGTTNAFHIKTRSDLAILYNDRSPLENHHVACLFMYLNEPETNICQNMSEQDYNQFRSLVVEMILGTDMQQHYKQLEKMKESLKTKEELKKPSAMCLILHSADISNPAKPYNIHRKWTDCLLEEYFTQGDDEITMGLEASLLTDRTTTNIPGSQIGFIEYIVSPCFKVLHEVMLELARECVENRDNKEANGVEMVLETQTSWADARKDLLIDEAIEIVPVEQMEHRVNECAKKIQDILDSNCNIWKRQQEKVKEDEENAKRRQEIDDELNSKQ